MSLHKRARTQTHSDPGFCTRHQLSELDTDSCDVYVYHLPAHMGGTRRSLRQKTLVQTYEEEMLTLLSFIEDLNGTLPPPPLQPQELEECDTPLQPLGHQMGAAVDKLMPRVTLQYNDACPSKVWTLVQTVFNLLGSPPEFVGDGRRRTSCWDGAEGVINTIRDYLFLGHGWRRRRTIRRVLEYVRHNIDDGVAPGDIGMAGMKRKGQGRKRKLNAEMDTLVAKSLSKGYGMQLTTAIVNTKSVNAGGSKVHISTVFRSAKGAYTGRCHNRGLKKTGNRDVDSVWCRSRLALALQLSQQFREDTQGASMVGKRVVRVFPTDDGDDGKAFFGHITDYDPVAKFYKVVYQDGDEEELEYHQLRHPLWPKLYRMGILWCDEKHKKVVIGPNNRHEWLFCVDPLNPDVYMSAKDGGVRQKPRRGTRAKYMKECRGLFAVMAVEQPDGTCVGRRMEPFNYTGQKVVGPVTFEKAVKAEVRRVANLKTTGTTRSQYWKDAGTDLPGGAYEARYGDTWRQEVVERLGRGGAALCNVTDLMDHTIAQGNALFADTPYADTWTIYHDALSSWWSKGAQEYLASKNFQHRQVCCLDFTASGTRYEGGLPGDTPEYMPLDSNLFSDLEKMVRWNVAATNEMPRGHPDKFDLTTPASCWSAVSRTWAHAPTSDRIVEDINRVFCSIEQVITENGAAVDFNKLRHGRRLDQHIRSRRRSIEHSAMKTFNDIEGLHPVCRRVIIDLCDL